MIALHIILYKYALILVLCICSPCSMFQLAPTIIRLFSSTVVIQRQFRIDWIGRQRGTCQTTAVAKDLVGKTQCLVANHKPNAFCSSLILSRFALAA